MVGIIGICLFLLLIFLNMPIGFAMAVVGFGGMCILKGMEPGFSVIATEPFRTAAYYIFSVIPLFVLMGYLAAHTRLSADAFYVLNKWIGHLPGGLAMGTVGACTIFAAVCGDPISTAATITSVSVSEMRKYGYSDELSLGCIAAGGNLGFLIPPSLVFIIYAFLTEQSVGVLFISGIMPGLLLAFLFVLTIYFICKINPKMGPSGPKASWMERLKASPKLFGVLIVILLVLGGIYTGMFTPTEAAGIGVFAMLLVTLINRQLTWQGFTAALSDTAVMTGMVFILIIGALIFNKFIVVSGIPLILGDFIAGLEVPPIFILIFILIAYILVGCIMDIIGVILIVVPILHPLLVGMGFDPIWLAVLTVITVLIGGLTPPVGIVCYAIAGMVKDVPLFVVFRGSYPFIGAMVVCLIILIAFPQISLFLPNLMIPR
jgi:tripartite ATP-independent transporter DctM subunit